MEDLGILLVKVITSVWCAGDKSFHDGRVILYIYPVGLLHLKMIFWDVLTDNLG